jgi:nicotinamidase-related amidase
MSIEDSRASGRRYLQQLLSVAFSGPDDIKTSSVELMDDGSLKATGRDGMTIVKADSNGKIVSYETFESMVEKAQNIYLYLIDLQADFVDGGNFGVYGGGTMIEDLKIFLENLKDKKKGKLYVRITRDYHPHSNVIEKGYPHFLSKMNSTRNSEKGHCSFYKSEDDHPPAFPIHCEQGEAGTLLHGGLDNASLYPDDKTLVMIKGIYPEHDCFAGFPYQTKEDLSKSQLHACTSEHESSITNDVDSKAKTGGYVLKKLSIQDALKFNDQSSNSKSGEGSVLEFPNGDVAEHVSESDHLNGIKAGDVVIVTGLAGDFCVINTASNIKKYLKEIGIAATVFVPQHLTRYPILSGIVFNFKDTEDIKSQATSIGKSQKPKLLVPKGVFSVGTSLISEFEGGKNIFYTADTEEEIGSLDSTEYGYYVTDEPLSLLNEYEDGGLVMVDFPVHFPEKSTEKSTEESTEKSTEESTEESIEGSIEGRKIIKHKRTSKRKLFKNKKTSQNKARLLHRISSKKNSVKRHTHKTRK